MSATGSTGASGSSTSTGSDPTTSAGVTTGSSGTTTVADTGTGSGSGSGSETGEPNSCAAVCGEVPCLEDEGDCLGDDPICFPPAPEACQSCMERSCGDQLAEFETCWGQVCLDFAVVVRGCGDAEPYAPEPLLGCIADFCSEVCVADEVWTGCLCT